MPKKKEAPKAPPAPEPEKEKEKEKEKGKAGEEDTETIKQLKAMDDEFCKLELEFEIEKDKLRQKYNERQAPILAKRLQVLSDPSSCAEEDKKFGTPACKGFWVSAFQNDGQFAEVLEEHDEPALEYLKDIRKTDLDPDNPQKGFKLEYEFVENPFFSNTVLSSEYHFEYDPKTYKPWKDLEIAEIKSSTIEWKAGKNLTVEVVAKKPKGGGAKKQKQKAKAKEEPRMSAFRILFINAKAGEESDDIAFLASNAMGGEVEEIEDMVLDQVSQLGVAIGTQLVPYAVRYYTGEAGEKDDFDDDEDEESEEDDDDDDDDEDDDEDDEDDEPPKGAAKKKAQKKGGAPPAAGGQKQEECKQQ